MEVNGNQCWILKSPLLTRLVGGEEMVELPAGQELITIATYRNEEVEVTAQGKYFMTKKAELITAGEYTHDWL